MTTTTDRNREALALDDEKEHADKLANALWQILKISYPLSEEALHGFEVLGSHRERRKQ